MVIAEYIYLDRESVAARLKMSDKKRQVLMCCGVVLGVVVLCLLRVVVRFYVFPVSVCMRCYSVCSFGWSGCFVVGGILRSPLIIGASLTVWPKSSDAKLIEIRKSILRCQPVIIS